MGSPSGCSAGPWDSTGSGLIGPGGLKGSLDLICCLAIGLLLLVGLWPHPAAAQFKSDSETPSPGFGLLYGEGLTANGARLKRFGFTSRRLTDSDRIGSLALVYETHTDGLRFSNDEPAAQEDVTLEYHSLYGELKRYYHAAGPLLYYWGLRGGYTRVDGSIQREEQESKQTFRKEQIAPLALLALPFALEHPGFLLLALVDGTSAGLVLDIVPEHIWLDLQFSSVVVPYRIGSLVTLDDLLLTTTTLQLVVAF